MALTRWEPFEGMTSLRREMDRLFDTFFDRSPISSTIQGGMLEPAIEIADTKDAVMVKAQVPGVSKENLHIDIMDDVLTLRGEMKEETKTEEQRFHRREFRYGAFSRTIPLPTSVQADQCSAELREGILTITLPKSQQARVKQIPIQGMSEGGNGARQVGQGAQSTTQAQSGSQPHNASQSSSTAQSHSAQQPQGASRSQSHSEQQPQGAHQSPSHSEQQPQGASRSS
jgi:HSP20 family protein